MQSTLGTMKAEIADELDRTDGSLDDQIANYIDRSIDFYKRTRFYFNVDNKASFLTVPGQWAYSELDDINIPRLSTIDMIECNDRGIQFQVMPMDPYGIELLAHQTTPTTGRPDSYALYNRELWLYPVPDVGPYRIRVWGHWLMPGPTDDDDTDNDWMNEAYHLIKSRAMVYLATFKTRNAIVAQAMMLAEQDALQRLYSETSQRVARGVVTPTKF